MPAVFVLVMSFTLKNTLDRAGRPAGDRLGAGRQQPRRRRNGPANGWRGTAASASPSREALQAALKARQVEAGVVVRAPWLGRRRAPAQRAARDVAGQPGAAGGGGAAARRAELFAAAGADEDRRRRGRALRERAAGKRGQRRPAVGPGRARGPLPVRDRVGPRHDGGAAERAGLADLRHVLRRHSDRRRADPGAQRRHAGAPGDLRRLAGRDAGRQAARLHAAELGAAGLHAAGRPLARAAAGRRCAEPGHLRPAGSC